MFLGEIMAISDASGRAAFALTADVATAALLSPTPRPPPPPTARPRSSAAVAPSE